MEIHSRNNYLLFCFTQKSCNLVLKKLIKYDKVGVKIFSAKIVDIIGKIYFRENSTEKKTKKLNLLCSRKKILVDLSVNVKLNYCFIY